MLIRQRTQGIVSKIPVRMPLKIMACVGVAVLIGQLMDTMFTLRSDMDAYVVPRTLTRTQANAIQKVLSASESPGPINVFSDVSDLEATAYAGWLSGAMINGGWDARDMPVKPWDASDPEKNGGDFYNVYVAMDQGVSIRTCTVGQPKKPDPRHPTPDVVLRTAFEAAHLNVGSGSKYNCAKYSFIVEVGRRPLEIRTQPLRAKIGEWITRHLVFPSS